MQSIVRKSSRSVRWMNSIAISCSALFNTQPTTTAKPVSYSASHSYSVPSLRHQHPLLLDWAKAKEAEVAGRTDSVKDDWHYNQPLVMRVKPEAIVKPSAKVRRRLDATSKLYFDKFGRDTVESFIWSGIESGNPLTRDEQYRWNSLREQGLYDSANRKKLVSSLKSVRMRNIRMGMSNHEIDLDRPQTWSEHDAMMKDLKDGGMKISLDLHHFGIESHFAVKDAQGRTIGPQSYYLNPAWPRYFARFSRDAIARYHDKIEAITIMNEPETVVGFNGEMLHGGYPGWSAPESNRIYIDRSMQVGKASVMARLEIERFMRTLPPHQRKRFLYMHTEASVYKASWPDFNLYRRFVVSDMILGHEWLMKANLDWLKNAPIDEFVGLWHRLPAHERTVFHWVIENGLVYNVAPHERELFRQKLWRNLVELQNLHRQLDREFNIDMRTDTVFAVDYYAHNEDKGADGKTKLSPEPQDYVAEIERGDRGGLYKVVTGYYNHYQMPMMIGESGTPYYHYASRWNQQMLLELAQAAEHGVPILGYTIYPAVDTFGWESALSVDRKYALHNPAGVTRLAPEIADPVERKKVELLPRPSIRRFVEFLSKGMRTETP